MPRQIAPSVQNNFVKGLVTEATGLNFPENACTETYNCVFERDGSVRRRLGIDYEASYSTQTVSRSTAVVNTYYWASAAGSGDNTLVVVQAGSTLYFYKVGSSALSSDMIDTIDLNTHKVSGSADVDEKECQFTSGNGYLFVSHPTCETFYVEYDSDTDTVSATEITVEVRDFDGVDDSLDVDERPSTLSDEHEYNLLNQGWFVEFWYDGASNTAKKSVITRWNDRLGDYPANNHIWYLCVNVESDGDPKEVFDPKRAGTEQGNTPAPKGHYILEAFYKDRSDASGVTGLDVVSSGIYRPSSVAFHAGRVWYSGVTGQKFSNKIYFSQIVEDVDQFGRCYQQNDPTSRETFDLLPTDGGVVTIPEAGTIIKLWPIQNMLMVFASNGVWGITGSEGIGFTATDFSVNKLSDVGALTPSSFVSVGGFPAWWNEEDIYIASNADVSGNVDVKPLVDQTIRTFYETIPQSNKRYVKGAFNTRTRTVHWVYRSTSASDLTEAYEFDRVLNFNILTGSFYPWSVNNSGVSINGVLVVEGQASTTGLEDVTNSSGTTVTDSALATVQANVTETVDLSAVTKFLSTVANAPNYDLTFSEETSTDYLDWFENDSTGIDFTSYFITGYRLPGGGQQKFQSNYVYIYNKTNSEQNQIDFQSQWNFANTGDTGRWSSTQRITFPNESYDYQYKRIKTRGHGVANQFRVTSVSGEPFELIGWSLFETQNQSI